MVLVEADLHIPPAVVSEFLTSIDVSRSLKLRKLPIDILVAMKSLVSVNCSHCPNLITPPPEIAEQVMRLESVNHTARQGGCTWEWH